MPDNNQINVLKIQLLTRRDLASTLKVGISSVDKIPEDELPKVHIGKSVRYTFDSVYKYIKEHEKKKEIINGS